MRIPAAIEFFMVVERDIHRMGKHSLTGRAKTLAGGHQNVGADLRVLSHFGDFRV